MKEMKDVRVDMFRIVGDFAPMIQVNYKDKNAEDHTGLLIFDSGSNENILISDIANRLGECKIEDKTGSIFTINGDSQPLEYIDFAFAFGGQQFNEVFGTGNVLFPNVAGELKIIGILGISFMQQYKLVIDYSNFTIHSSDVRPDNLSIEDCDFFVPMAIGLKYYDMPLLFMYQNGKEIMALADTGASSNVLASQTISDNDFDCKFTEGIDTIVGLAGDVDMREAMVNFQLLTLKGNDVGTMSYQDLFKVSPNYVYTPEEGQCDDKGNQLPSIEAIICSPFMAKQGWVLDFGARVIYKRRKEIQ